MEAMPSGKVIVRQTPPAPSAIPQDPSGTNVASTPPSGPLGLSTSLSSTANGSVPTSTSTSSSASNEHSTTKVISDTVSTLTTLETTTPSRSFSPLPSPSSSTTAHSGPVSHGTIAAATIGGAVAGAIVASVLLCLLYQRKRSVQRPLDHGRSRLVGPRVDSLRSPEMAMTTMAKSDTRSTGDDLLPAPILENELAGHVTDLSMSIKNHAHSYYGGGDALAAGQAGANLLTILKTPPTISAKKLSALLANPLYNVKAIRFTIAWSLLEGSNCSGPPSHSLLPPEIATCIHEMDVHPNNGKVFPISTISNLLARLLSAGHSAMRSIWRQMTVALMMHPERNEIDADDHRFENIQGTLKDLETVLAPLASKRTDNERRQDLGRIVKQAAQLTCTIFALPACWEWAWSNPHGERASEFVVFPALVQTGDDQGRMLSDRTVLTEAQIVNIGNILS